MRRASAAASERAGAASTPVRVPPRRTARRPAPGARAEPAAGVRHQPWDAADRPDPLEYILSGANIAVVHIFSKAYGLAGIRLGMLFAHSDLVKLLSGVKYPYNVNALSLKEAMDGLNRLDLAKEWITTILEERDALATDLASLDQVKEVFPSDANFLLIRVKNPSGLYNFLMERGVIVRDRSSVPRCEGCLRITIGSPEENRKLMDTLEKYLKS